MTDLDDLKHCIRTEWAELDITPFSCLVRKVKQRHWLGEADFCCVSSFAFVTIFLAKNYNNTFESVKVMSKVLLVAFFPQKGIFQW